MAHLVKDEDLKTIIPKSELKPINFQLDSNQSLYFGGLARFCLLYTSLEIHHMS